MKIIIAKQKKKKINFSEYIYKLSKFFFSKIDNVFRLIFSCVF
jgi:hypothetical protein